MSAGLGHSEGMRRRRHDPPDTWNMLILCNITQKQSCAIKKINHIKLNRCYWFNTQYDFCQRIRYFFLHLGNPWEPQPSMRAHQKQPLKGFSGASVSNTWKPVADTSTLTPRAHTHCHAWSQCGQSTVPSVDVRTVNMHRITIGNNNNALAYWPKYMQILEIVSSREANVSIWDSLLCNEIIIFLECTFIQKDDRNSGNVVKKKKNITKKHYIWHRQKEGKFKILFYIFHVALV